MRPLYRWATLAFWLMVGASWIAAKFVPPETDTVTAKIAKPINAAELGQHAQADDCWMAIRGEVYDVSPYLPEHPSRPDVIVPWCGREATEGYATKGKNRPHSAQADALLGRYRIGVHVAK